MKSGDLCLVTGVSGYLGSWLAKDLLERGMRVRGTIRSLADEGRVARLRQLLPGVELVAADLCAETGWRAAMTDVAWVFHVASPQADKRERNRTAGATAGTRHVMLAACAAASVRKIVVTSSEAAIAYGHPRTKAVISEADWTDVTAIGAGADYLRSKTLAERLAWELARDSKTNPRGVPLATVNPGLILGPSLVPWGRFSLQMLSDIAAGKMPLMLDMAVHMVDVRDCAAMHIAVMEAPAANGHRHLCSADVATFADIAGSVGRQFSKVGYRPRARIAPAWLAWLLARVSSDVKSIYSHVGTRPAYRPANPALYQYRHTGLDAIVSNSMHSILHHGWLAARPALAS